LTVPLTIDRPHFGIVTLIISPIFLLLSSG
jgi:hypothetical protein